VDFFKELSAKREQRARAAELGERSRDYEREHAAWAEEVDNARDYLALALTTPDAFVDPSREVPMLLKKGEFAVLVMAGAGLIEMGREAGSYQGGSQGVSFRVMKGVSYRVGGHRGTFVPGPEVLKVVDTGTVVITNQRVVFQGAGRTREWLFTKLIGVDHDPERPLTMLHVSNRQKASGFAYTEKVSDEVRLRMDVALAHYSDDLGELQLALKERVAEFEAAEPRPPMVDEPRPDQ
jgi:hypothetical protein